MKVIFRDKSPVCIGQGDDAETLVWCRSIETHTYSQDAYRGLPEESTLIIRG